MGFPILELERNHFLSAGGAAASSASGTANLGTVAWSISWSLLGTGNGGGTAGGVAAAAGGLGREAVTPGFRWESCYCRSDKGQCQAESVIDAGHGWPGQAPAMASRLGVG